jgi:hypothetical protein
LSHETHDEDRTLLTLIEALERGAAPALGDLTEGAPRDEAGETLTRLYTESLGLIPYALDPVVPSAAVRRRLMAIVTGDETQEVDRPAAAPASPALPPTPPAPLAVARPADAALPAAGFGAGFQARRARRWPLALAAGFVLALLGLSAWLYQGRLQTGRLLDADRAEVARLQRELDAERANAAEFAAARAELAGLRARVGELESSFSLVTSPTVEMSALRPTGRVALARQARGRLYIADDHQHWYLSVHDLAPSGAGREYQLWFLGDQGAVSGGTFTAAPGAPVNLSSAHMPAGTKAIIITLEPAPGASAPSGPEVLRASPPVKIL